MFKPEVIQLFVETVLGAHQKAMNAVVHGMMALVGCALPVVKQ